MASQITLVFATAIGYSVWLDGKVLLPKALHLLVAEHGKSNWK